MTYFQGKNADLAAVDASNITPSDTAVIEPLTRAIYIGGAGDLAVEMSSGAQITFVAVQSGAVLPLQVRKIRATGTTATAIIALR